MPPVLPAVVSPLVRGADRRTKKCKVRLIERGPDYESVCVCVSPGGTRTAEVRPGADWLSRTAPKQKEHRADRGFTLKSIKLFLLRLLPWSERHPGLGNMSMLGEGVENSRPLLLYVTQ